MSVDKKILEIMQVVKILSKDGKISFGNTKYNFISDEEVVAKLRQEMIDRGLIMYPKLSESEIVESGNKFLTKEEWHKLLSISHNNDCEYGSKHRRCFKRLF